MLLMPAWVHQGRASASLTYSPFLPFLANFFCFFMTHLWKFPWGLVSGHEPSAGHLQHLNNTYYVVLLSPLDWDLLEDRHSVSPVCNLSTCQILAIQCTFVRLKFKSYSIFFSKFLWDTTENLSTSRFASLNNLHSEIYFSFFNFNKSITYKYTFFIFERSKHS